MYLGLGPKTTYKKYYFSLNASVRGNQVVVGAQTRDRRVPRSSPAATEDPRVEETHERPICRDSKSSRCYGVITRRDKYQLRCHPRLLTEVCRKMPSCCFIEQC
ncbi:hypothetical protein TNCV_4122571 [Trichonephila clavipes]|nr:hypothetical protein TNCV_4122571 [Trichonephila clavipes]